MVTELVDVVVGVDTHRDQHVLVVVDARSGGVIDEATIPAERDGYRQALALVACSGSRAWAVEGCGSYGAGLTRFLVARGERVFEVERPVRTRGRDGRFKDDGLDAARAARSLLAGQAAGQPRVGGGREALRVLLVAREAAIDERRAGLNQLRALVLTAPGQLRDSLIGLPKRALLTRCSRLRPARRASVETRAVMVSLRSLARRVTLADREAKTLEHELADHVRTMCPWLVDQPGIGPISAAQILVSWSHPGRLCDEAAFARLAGVAPIPASSGKRIRYRLDRGGDRRLNRALHTIIVSRRKTDPATIAYIQRRQAEGKTAREAIRCLKRFLARSLYRQLETQAAMT
jgi:transposase